MADTFMNLFFHGRISGKFFSGCPGVVPVAFLDPSAGL